MPLFKSCAFGIDGAIIFEENPPGPLQLYVLFVLPPATLKLAVAPSQTVAPDTAGVGVGVTLIDFTMAQVLVAGLVPVVVARAV